MYELDENTKELLFNLLCEVSSKTHLMSDELFLAFIGTVMDEREHFYSELPFAEPFETVPALERLLENSREIHENN